MNVSKYLASASLILFGSGIAIALPLGSSWLQEQQAIAAAPTIIRSSPLQPPKPQQVVISGNPVHISVSSVNVDTSIVNGVYNAQNGTWTLSEDSAFFAAITSPANTIGGNTFIYGHDSAKIFGNLRSITTGAVATVTTDNGYEFIYTFVSTEKVQPTDVLVLDYTASPARLTLQTCPGVPNLTRQMFYFTLISYKKV
jgi:LPXTG-site transpeptidase (sortase) family protein